MNSLLGFLNPPAHHFARAVDELNRGGVTRLRDGPHIRLAKFGDAWMA
jgi:hypothetical protein